MAERQKKVKRKKRRRKRIRAEQFPSLPPPFFFLFCLRLCPVHTSFPSISIASSCCISAPGCLREKKVKSTTTSNVTSFRRIPKFQRSNFMPDRRTDLRLLTRFLPHFHPRAEPTQPVFSPPPPFEESPGSKSFLLETSSSSSSGGAVFPRRLDPRKMWQGEKKLEAGDETFIFLVFSACFPSKEKKKKEKRLLFCTSPFCSAKPLFFKKRGDRKVVVKS